MHKPKITNPNEFILKRKGNQDDLKTTSEHYFSQSTIGASAVKVMNFNGSIPNEDISLEYTKELLERSFKNIRDGDLSQLEEMLFSQAIALNMAFNSLATRATRQHDATTIQMFMHLCFKAQNQSRATIDSLAQLSQPNKVTFIRQANIAKGHMQVNSFPEKNKVTQNELLKDSYAELDSRTAPTTKEVNPKMEALEAINRRQNTGR